MPTINIVFDIDDSIATGFGRDINQLEQDHPWIILFKKCNLYVDAIKPHIIHPGVIEFIQLIDKMPNIKISFFSSAIKERNSTLVEKLLCFALGKARYEAIKNQIKICSEEDLEEGDDILSKTQYENYGICYRENKKNLKRVLAADDELAWTVLIDDDMTYSYYGQEKNILKIPAVWESHFSDAFCHAFKYSEKREELPWKTFCRANHIFYAIGILFSALEMVNQEKSKTLSEALFKIQFKENTCKQDRLKWVFNYELYDNMHYYEYGLKKLREVNSSLCFLSHENYLNQSNIIDPPTKEFVKNMVSHSGLYQATPILPNEVVYNADTPFLNLVCR